MLKKKKRKSKKRLLNNKVVVICHNIRSAFNVGSIFRTADAAGVDKIILGGYSAHPPHPKLLKVSLGAEEAVAHEKSGQVWRQLDLLKKQGYQILALEKTGKAKNIFKFKAKKPFVLILGNEKRGLSLEILKRCDEVLAIPMSGQKESLNVSVAFGVAIYQLTNF